MSLRPSGSVKKVEKVDSVPNDAQPSTALHRRGRVSIVKLFVVIIAVVVGATIVGYHTSRERVLQGNHVAVDLLGPEFHANPTPPHSDAAPPVRSSKPSQFYLNPQTAYIDVCTVAPNVLASAGLGSVEPLTKSFLNLGIPMDWDGSFTDIAQMFSDAVVAKVDSCAFMQQVSNSRLGEQENFIFFYKIYWSKPIDEAKYIAAAQGILLSTPWKVDAVPIIVGNPDIKDLPGGITTCIGMVSTEFAVVTSSMNQSCSVATALISGLAQVIQ